MSAPLLVTALMFLANPSDAFEAGSVTVKTAAGESLTIPYRLLPPTTVEEGKTYPLVVFLHGAGERGDDNKRQLKYLPTWMAPGGPLAKHECYLLAPQCPQGMKWADVDWSVDDSTPMTEKPTAPMLGVIAAIEEVLSERPIDKTRVSLTGLSMGGFGSYDLAARKSEWFSAVAPICGGFDEKSVGKLKGLPIRIYHGDADRAVTIERSRRMSRALSEAGIEHDYTEYPGVGHDSWTKAYRETDLIAWLLKQQKRETK